MGACVTRTDHREKSRSMSIDNSEVQQYLTHNNNMQEGIDEEIFEEKQQGKTQERFESVQEKEETTMANDATMANTSPRDVENTLSRSG